MTSKIFGKPSRPKIQGQQPIEDVEVIEEEAGQARERERRRLVQRRGRSSTILSGIMSALKKRLGE